jgi:hypothetical protein
VQRGYEVVVPLDAVRTLDMLKKGSAVVAQSARGDALRRARKPALAPRER